MNPRVKTGGTAGLFVLPIALLLLATTACRAADFTARDNSGAADLVGELELRGRIPAVSSQVPLTAREVMQALPDTGRFAAYRRRLETAYPVSGYRFQATTELSGTIGNRGRRPSAGSASKLGMLGAFGAWSFAAVNTGQTGDRVPTTSAGYRWRGVAANSDQIYVRWSGPAAHVQIGKDYLKTGEGLAMSDRQPFEQFQGHYDLSRMFRLTWLTGQLDKYSDSNGIYNRYLAGHRLEFRTARFCIGANEYVLYGGVGRTVEWYYLLPFYVFQGEQDNRPLDDNVIWDIDAKVIVPPFRMKIEAMIDDIQIERKVKSDQEPQEIGLACDVSVAVADIPAFITQHVAYQMVTGWTYNQNKTWNRWLYNSEPLGAEYGNDFDRLALTTTATGTSYRGKLELALLRKGEGRIADPWTDPWVNDSTWVNRFPSGVVERCWTVSVSGQRDFLMRYRALSIISSVSLQLRYETTVNAGHQSDRIENRFDATIGLSLECFF
ncbi:MAG: hypothetical protein QME74_03190 [Candidatus Edwardsbacteria bacterium]|nr:hypothetical protein [Candidatus Edwardsbacteria bacterium]